MPLSLELAAEAATTLGIANAAVVQKDYSVVEVLGAVRRVSGPPGARLVFSGGTCLAKAHRLTLRMSEDIDLKVVVPGAEGLSRNQLRATLGRVKDAVEASLTASGFVLREPPVARNGNRKVEFLLAHEGSQGASRVMRPGVKLELFQVPLLGPTEFLPVSSMLNQVKESAPEIEAMECVSVLETAAEKFVALTRRTAGQLEGTRPQATDPFIVRHLYDLHCIARSPVHDPGAIVAMARRAALSDAEQFQSWFPAYRQDPALWTERAIETLAASQAARAHYERFQDEMVFGPPVGFGEALETLRSLGSLFLQGFTPASGPEV